MPLSFRLLAGSLLALTLAAAPPASAQLGLPELPDHLGSYDVVLGPDGSASCVPAEASETPGARRTGGAPNLTVLPSLNPPELLGGLRIVLRATDQLLERPDALLAFRRAAARWERAITTPITVVYDIDYGPTRFGAGTYAPSTIASANGASSFAGGSRTPASVADVVARMRERAAGDAQLQALYDAIPDPVPSTVLDGDGNALPISFIFGTQPTLQVLGYLPAQLDPDPVATPFGSVPNLGFNSAFSFDFDPNDGTDPNLIDFEAIVIHEMGHSLGFASAIGFAAQSFGVLATPWDLFRVRPDAVAPNESFTDGQGWETTERVVTPGPPETETFEEGGETYFEAVQVFYDGLREYETSTATGGGQGGDGQQASHWRDDARRPPTPRDDGDRYIGIMDPNFGRGVRQLYKFPDLRVLETLGYGIDYAPTYAGGFELAIAGAPVRIDTLRVAPVGLGDVGTGLTVSVPVTLTNPGALNPLAFDAEVVTDAVYPEGTALTAAFDTDEGVVAAGQSLGVNLQIGGASEPAFFAGRIRFRTNFDSLLVVEVPVEFSVGGATEPALALAGIPDDNDFGDFGDLGAEDAATVTVTLSNGGSLPLRYEVLTQLQARAFPFDPAPNARSATPPGARAVLAGFVGAHAAAAADVRYAFDFEDPAAFDALPKGGSVPGDWQLVSGGAAALDGHSPTRAAYFGQVTPDPAGDVYQYRNNASGQLLLPAIDLSDVGPEDLATLSFNYYLQAEEGFDFAAVLYSVDGGTTFETAATSDDGLLMNTDAGWMSVMVDVSAVTGLPDPVLFAFEFVSDGGITDEGWYVDDVQVAVLADANPFYAAPRAGVLGGGESQEVTVTASGPALEPNFYTGVVSVATNQREDDPAPLRLAFSAGDPAVPALVPSTPAISVSLEEGDTEEFDLGITNPGVAPLTFVRVLEPALGLYDAVPAAAAVPTFQAAEVAALDGEVALAEAALDPAAEGGRVADADAVVELPTTFALAITQLPDGRVVASEAGSQTSVPRTFIASEDLATVEAFDGVVPLGNQVLAVAYNDRTESLWYAGFQSGLLYEVKIDGTTLTRTDRTVNVGFAISALAYSEALDVFFAVPYNSDLVFAFSVDGRQVPGTPFPFFRGSFYQGLSVTGGVLEIGYLDRFNADRDQISYVLYDQFGRLYRANNGSPVVVIDDPDVTASQAVRSFVRSRTDPDGVLYVLTRGSDALNAKIVSLDPPDLDPTTQTFIAALEPAFAKEVAPQGQASVSLALRPAGAAGEVVRDTVAFVTNSPNRQVVRIPVEVSVTGGVAAEDGAPDAFALHGARPNPLRGDGLVAFSLPEAADVTVSVYNTLGQRVAVLASGEPMAAGGHTLPLRAGALAAGVYVVRVDAGPYVGTQKVSVIR